MKGNVEIFTREECDGPAEKFFRRISGIDQGGEKFKSIAASAEKVFGTIEERINPRGIYGYTENVELAGRRAVIEGVKFDCPAFEQVNCESVYGAAVYFVTAGDFHLDGFDVIDQVYADMWGTAYAEILRGLLRDRIAFRGIPSNDFGPGLFGMNVTQTRDIAGIIDPSLIDIEIKASAMMVPVKSCAGIYFDATPDYRQLRNECQDCRGIAESCSLCEIRQSR